MGNKDLQVKLNFYKTHLDRRQGFRGRKLWRLSSGEDLLKLARRMNVPLFLR